MKTIANTENTAHDTEFLRMFVSPVP